MKGPLRGRPPEPRQPVSRDAQRIAAAILEVLAGVRTPTDAAAALGICVPRYYLWEQRALEGFVSACEPRSPGEYAGQQHEMAILRKEVVRLRQDCTRQAGPGAGFAADDRLSTASATRPEIWQEGHGQVWRPRRRQAETQAAACGTGTEGQRRSCGPVLPRRSHGNFVLSDLGRSGTTD